MQNKNPWFDYFARSTSKDPEWGKELDFEGEEIVDQVGPFPATPYDWFFC